MTTGSVDDFEEISHANGDILAERIELLDDLDDEETLTADEVGDNLGIDLGGDTCTTDEMRDHLDIS
ncbi:hypothetical protein [Haloplanus pelagicus]|jgi:hypothetical protein|uniref:hypothetical protein n=1 Tax=Haloplanus pelagicus TaxID=2949995 RepID=UPI002040423F|nr:hypothetical protein [Haloplanus sp. HW8-1]